MRRLLCLFYPFARPGHGPQRASAHHGRGNPPKCKICWSCSNASTRAPIRSRAGGVQILATTDRVRLETVETDFKVNYPNIPVDWVHTKPYYKLRAGAFETKQEAERLRYTLSRQFEGVYLVKADVNKAELLRMY